MSQARPRPLWDPEQYGQFADERSRPFYDLLADVAISPRRIVDLGCGPGTLTASLLVRWPDATVLGVDNAPEMIDRAQVLTQPGRLTFELADLASWHTDEPVDLIVSNAALQWVPGHRALVPRFASMLVDTGMLAFQVPGNFDAPSHTVVGDLCRTPTWRQRLGPDDQASELRAAMVAEPAEYLRDLIGAGLVARVWETTYLHLLDGADPVLEWMKGTALRPILARLGDDAQTEFLTDLAPLLRQAYPAASFGTVLPFRRIFAVGSKA